MNTLVLVIVLAVAGYLFTRGMMAVLRKPWPTEKGPGHNSLSVEDERNRLGQGITDVTSEFQQQFDPGSCDRKTALKLVAQVERGLGSVLGEKGFPAQYGLFGKRKKKEYTDHLTLLKPARIATLKSSLSLVH